MRTKICAKIAAGVAVVLGLICFASCMLDDREIHLGTPAKTDTGPNTDGTLAVSERSLKNENKYEVTAEDSLHIDYEYMAEHTRHQYADRVCTVCGKYEESKGLEFALNDDNKSYGVIGMGSCTDSSIVIPEEYNGLPITRITYSAFCGNSRLTNIIIPASITHIDEYAFSGCDNLIYNRYENGCYLGDEHNPYSVLVKVENISAFEFKMHNSTRIICSNAFDKCSMITRITMSDNIIDVYSSVFDGCRALRYNIYDNGYYLGNENNPYLLFVKVKDKSITELKINEKTKIMCDGAVSGCVNLTYVNIPFGVTSIGNEIFYGCESLEKIIIPETVTSIGERIADGCNSLESIAVSVGNKVYHNDGDCLIDTENKILIAGCKNSVIPTDGSVTSIGSYAFGNCRVLKSIIIPSNVKKIGEGAFMRCSELKEVIISDGVAEISYGAFYNCDKLESVTIEGSVKSIGSNAFSNCRNLKSVTMAEGVTKIGERAFEDCISIININLPTSVSHIGFALFEGCYGLENIEVAKGNKVYHSSGSSIIETAGKTLIVGCKNSVIPTDGSVTIIGDSAFAECSELCNIAIPDCITSIEYNAFSRCRRLTDITYAGTMEQWEKIEKKSDWKIKSNIAVIHCSDGDIEIKK